MHIYQILRNNKAQTMIEYMLLMAAVVSIVLIAFKSTILPGIQESSNLYFNRTAWGIYGNASRCGDGDCSAPFETPCSCFPDCGSSGSCDIPQ